MKKITVLLASLAAATSIGAAASVNPPRKTLTAFASEAELAALFKGWAEERERRLAEQRRRADEARQRLQAQGQASPVPQAPMAKAAAEAAGPTAGALASADSLTNVQHAGVDEGGIVKLHGEHLIILRRGRLFTVSVRDRELKAVAALDAFGGDVDPRGAWYDEMLVSGNTIAVIGYSYARGGTEIGLFEISKSGGLAYKATYHLRSNDYYSSRNYASRLIGSKLIFYTPLHLNPWASDPYAYFPALRRWRQGATPAEFKRIAPATRIYRADEPLDPWQGVALHSVSVCDLAKPELECESTAVLGQPGRVFYVSGGSVYVWTSAWRRAPGGAPDSAVFRIPLDGSAPSALKTAGSPIDQFSFLEGGDGHLNVLVRSNGRGDGMWAAETNAGDLALLRVPVASFSDGRERAPESAYRALPRPAGHALQNRYVGNYLLYGAGAGWRRPQPSERARLFAVRFAGGATAYEIDLPHGVDRIEALGANAVAVGTDGTDLHFTSVRLAGIPVEAGRYLRRNAAQGETRSHGFFYKPENEYEGLLGLPIIGAGEAAGRQLRRESAAVVYLRNRSLELSELGTLDSRARNANDGCRASCVDWYGNSRPLFLGKRVFALLGYELVEGRLAADKIVEARRLNFSPQAAEIAR